LNKSYRRLESRLEENDSNCPNQDILKKKGVANRKYISTTDPDASVVRRGRGRSKLQYQVHRGVDDKCEVITATEVTPGEIHASHLLDALVENHHQNTGQKVEIVVADSKYGTMNNYLSCHDQGIAAHIQSLEKTSRGAGSKIKRGIGYILKRIDIKMRLTLASQPTLVLSNFNFRPHCLV
jgi:DDE family transposase